MELIIALKNKSHGRERKPILVMEKSSLWHRVEQRRYRQRRDLFLVIGGFAVLLGAWFWYYFIYIRTPDYAIREFTAAIKRHDASALDRYVDLNRTIGHAYDVLVDDLFLYDADLTDETRAAYARFYRDIKPQLVAGVAETIRLHIATGEWPLPDGDALTKGRQLGIDFERFLERSQLRNSEVIKVGDFHVISRSATAPLSVRDRHTGIESTLTLSMEQAADGHWQITGIANYQQYLDAIAPRQNRDIADYIAATYDIVAEGNDELANLKERFRAITKNAGGKLEGASASELTSLISEGIIPALKERQRRLDTVSIPLGAQYLANLRHTSTELAIAAWQHYQRAVETQSVSEFNTAETLKKQEIETDLRITDIIRHNVVSQSLPNIP